MSIHPPEYFYPLYKPEDQHIYDLIVALSKNQRLPRIVTSKTERNEFTKLLILTGKIKNYRLFRDKVVEALEKGQLILKQLNAFGKTIKIPKGIDTSWAIFIQDQRICEILDALAETKISYTGSDKEFTEFLYRYLLTQLLQDWRGPKLAVSLESIEKKKISYSFLNKLLSDWDFTHIFK
ncbi:MAG: hypothetical protein HYS86_01080 [Candidatus Chisholmbacteria bacterium]|nr:hypothetical protein [Candidatus Chisholmbacteria bacterium]